MFEVAYTIISIQIIILFIIIILTWIYALPIIFIQRFHTATNILTLNVCLVGFLCSLHWTGYYILFSFYPTFINKCTVSCTVVPYIQTVVTCLVIYALLMITINRFFLIIYPNKPLFKRQRWSIISSIIQWIIAIILPLPYFTLSSKICLNSNMIPVWLRAYRLIIIVILPSILNGFFNLLIFLKVKLSSQRLTTTKMRITTINSYTKSLCPRDICLLKHMLLIHTVFVIGWGPINLLFLLGVYIKTPFSVDLFLRLLPSLSLLINIIDLFLYNHELRQYIKEQFLLKISL